MEQKNSVLDSVSAFFEAKSQLYDDYQRIATAALHTIQQGHCPVEDYKIEFRKWSVDTSWNEAALKYQFWLGLSEALKDELAPVETPATLERLIQLVIQLDRLLRERWSERIQSHRPTWVMPRAPPVTMATPISTTASSEGEPMQIGLMRSTLTPEERMRRQQANLCLYCDSLGHVLRNCPVRPSKFLSSRPTCASVTGSSPAYIILLISLQVAEGEVKFRAIVDSGACFLDLTLAKKLQIPLRPKRLSLTIHLADGTIP